MLRSRSLELPHPPLRVPCPDPFRRSALTEIAEPEVAQAEIAETEIPQTKIAESEVTQAKIAESEIAEPEIT